MRFVVISSFGAIASATDLVCSEDIVRNAESQGFVSYIYNCVWNEYTTIGSQACLAAFIDENALDNAFPITGTCRDAYQDLVDSWADNIKTYCPLSDILPGSDPVNVKAIFPSCISMGLDDSDALDVFYGATGFFPFRMCTGGQVREGEFASYMEEIWYSGAAWNKIPGFTACTFCYEVILYNRLRNPSDSVQDACEGTGLTTDSCLSTTLMINAREAFLQCAGYDMLTTGDMCTLDGVAAVDALIPLPYYTFAQCAYNLQTPFCATTLAYLDEIEDDTNSVDCLACYTELQSDLIALAADDTDDLCGKDVFSEGCLAYQSEALAAFELCSGFTLNTAFATVAPSVVTTAAPDTTAEATTAATTVAATTTKGAFICWISGLGFMVLLL